MLETTLHLFSCGRSALPECKQEDDQVEFKMINVIGLCLSRSRWTRRIHWHTHQYDCQLTVLLPTATENPYLRIRPVRYLKHIGGEDLLVFTQNNRTL